MLNQPATEAALPRSPSTPAEGAMHTTPTDAPMDALASEERVQPADSAFSVADVVAEFSPVVRPDMMPLALWSYARTCASQGWAGRAAAVAEHAFQLYYASRPPGLSVEAAKAEFQAFAGRTAAQVGL